jgi:hypothetical protein
MGNGSAFLQPARLLSNEFLTYGVSPGNNSPLSFSFPDNIPDWVNYGLFLVIIGTAIIIFMRRKRLFA